MRYYLISAWVVLAGGAWVAWVAVAQHGHPGLSDFTLAVILAAIFAFFRDSWRARCLREGRDRQQLGRPAPDPDRSSPRNVRLVRPPIGRDGDGPPRPRRGE